MYRQIGLLKKPKNMAKEEFKDWLLYQHAEKGKYLPNLKRYSYSFTLDNKSSLNPPAYDAFAEAWFESLDDLKEANKSDVMLGQIEDVNEHYNNDVNKLVRVIWAEEYIIDLPNESGEIPKNKKMFCQMGHLKCPPQMTKDDLKDWWLHKHVKNGRLLKDLKWYTVLFTLMNSPFGSPIFDGYGEVWFDNFKSLENSFDSDIMKKQFQDVKEQKLDDPTLHEVVIAEQFLIDLP